MYAKYEVKRMVELKKLVTFAGDSFPADHYFPGESHNFWEMVFVMSGKVGVTADKNVYIVERGNVVIHKPNEFHSIWSEGGTAPDVIILSFEAKNMPAPSSTTYILSDSDMNKIKQIAEDARTIFSYRYETYEPTSVICGKEYDASYLILSLECLIHEIMLNPNIEETRHNSLSARNYSLILSVLEENLYLRPDLPDIARLCNMSESNLKKVFSKYAGCGIMQYFHTMKMKKAAELLSGGMSVKETASTLGYADQNYFSSVFKRVIGISPSKYKSK